MLSKINILLVDDEALFRCGLISLLNKFGVYIINEAENGRQALEKIKLNPPDIILLDLEMPILNGSKTLDNIAKRFPDIKVIVISSYHDEELIKDHFNRGALAYISKGEKIEILLAAIQTVYFGSSYIQNIPALLKVKMVKDRHYFKLFYTKRELEIISLLIDGKQLKDMAVELCLAESTIEKHLTVIYKKTSVKTRSEFMKYAISSGLHFLGNPFGSKKAS